jgi:metallo-beta-lactamase class B
MRMNRLFLVFLLVTFVTSQLAAQTHKALTVEEALKRDINGNEEQRTKQFSPHRIMGNVYYVGAEMQASFLVATSQGLILINSNFEKSVPEIKKSVEDLGFKFSDVKILLGSHAHNDHQEGDALVKQLTGAQVTMMAEDVPLLEKITPGGKPHPVDKVVHHLDKVTLGETTLVAHLVAGHTPGATVWTTTVRENGRNYNVVIMSGMGAQQGLVDKDGKPTKLAETMEASFKYARTLPCDVFLGSHAVFYSMKQKYETLKSNPALISTPQNPFIDPQGYLNETDNYYKIFQSRMEDQRKAALAAKQ